MKQLITAIIAALWVAGSAHGYTQRNIDDGQGWQLNWLCENYATPNVTVCDDANSVDIAMEITGFSTITIFTFGSSGAFSCTIYVGSPDYPDKSSALLAGGSAVGTITSTSGPLVYANANFGVMWAECPTNPGLVNLRALGRK